MTFRGQRKNSSCCPRDCVSPKVSCDPRCQSLSMCLFEGRFQLPRKTNQNLGLSAFINVSTGGSSTHHMARISALTLELVSSESPAGRS